MAENKHRQSVIDVHVGNRIRHRRTRLGLSRRQLAETVGASARQIHDFETGATPVGVDRLFSLANALGTPVTSFYEGAGEENEGADPGPVPEIPAEIEKSELARWKVLLLLRAYCRLTDPRLQERVLDLVCTIAAENQSVQASRSG